MAKITITIDGDNVTVNQSAAPTKVEKENKKFFIIIRKNKYDETSWVEFVTDNYITVANKIRCLTYYLTYNNNDDYIYKLYVQDEDGTIMPCDGTNWDINRQFISFF